MNKNVLWFAAALAAFGVMLLFTSPAPAHPGVEGTVSECHQDRYTDQNRSEVPEDKEDHDSDEG